MCRTVNSNWFSDQTQTFAGMRFYSYLNSAKTILGEYDGTIPFAMWLKTYSRLSNVRFSPNYTGGKEIPGFFYLPAGG